MVQNLLRLGHCKDHLTSGQSHPSHGDSPPAEPPEPRPHSLAHPRESLAPIWIDPVQDAESAGDEQHGCERSEQDARCGYIHQNEDRAKDRRQ